MTSPLIPGAGDAAQQPARSDPALRRDTALVAAGQLAAVLSAFLVTLVGARVLPTDEFGALSWALSWLAFLAVLAQFGLTQVATILVAQREPRTHRALWGRLLAAQAVGVLVTAAFWQWAVGPAAAAAGTPSEVYRSLVLVVTCGLPAAAVGPVLVNVLRARRRFGPALVLGEHVRRVVLVAALLLAAAGVATARSARTALAWTVAVETGIYLIAVLLLVRVLTPGPAGRHAADRTAWAGPAATGPEAGAGGDDPTGSPWWLLRWGSTFALATLASVTVPQAGVWLLALVAPVEEVAVFSVAVRIAVLVAVPTAIGMRTLAPRIAAAAATDRLPALEEPVRRFAVWSTAATALAVAALAVAGPALLPALFGAGYDAALPAALLMCAGVLVNAWTGPCSVVLSHAGQERDVALSALVSSVAFAGLAAWWGAGWGGNGVAAAAAVGMAGRNLFLAWAAHRTLGIRTIALPARRGT